VIDWYTIACRFYIMRIPRRGLAFSRITFHADVTQCLGGLQPRPWYLVVAAPSGSVAAHPQQQDLVAFRIEHGQAVKMHKGTWHAGGARCSALLMYMSISCACRMSLVLCGVVLVPCRALDWGEGWGDEERAADIMATTMASMSTATQAWAAAAVAAVAHTCLGTADIAVPCMTNSSCCCLWCCCWHALGAAAGPLFDGPDGCYMDFYNLELSDTNLVDHNTHDYATQGLQYQVVDKDSSS
jgi:hypothetical protein